MTTNTDRSLIAAADLARITAELDVAHEDVALLERLKSAQDRVNRLTTDQAKATKERDRALAAEAKAAKASRFAHISDVRITEYPETMREHVLRSSWTIHWTSPTWDGFASLPKQHSIGLTACPPDVLDYLIEQHPERIPAKITALAPENPREAFRLYSQGLKRGWLRG
jgi:hypothetical protein